ncbi:MAG: hypothetical protein J7501_04440 [Bdellovibrio sp.]|nr:hypothetical protein [Bdellovibrio sp.]
METLSQSIRSNPAKFFSFLSSFTKVNPELSPLLKYQGWISGDSHPGQWSFVPNEGKFIYTMIDFDMAGKGPLLLDFMQYTLNIEAIIQQSPKSENKIRIKELLDAYLQGLRGGRPTPPEWASKILQKDDVSFLKKEQKYYRNKVTLENKLEVDQDFERLSDTSLTQEISFNLNSLGYFRNYDVVDVVQKKIERGGSAGQKRYWVLVREHSNASIIRIFELKEKQTGFLPEAQSSTEAMYSIFWGNSHPAYAELRLRNQDFEIRPKKVSLDEADIPYKLKKDSDWQYLKEKALYDLSLLGKAQSSQQGAAELATMIGNNYDQVAKLTKLFSQQYLSTLQK